MTSAHDLIHPALLSRTRSRKRRRRDPTHARRHHLQSAYGITVEHWNDLFEGQGRRCAICGTDNPKKWATDHCHTTLKVRGVLCPSCNITLGLMGDSPERLRAAAAYLEARA